MRTRHLFNILLLVMGTMLAALPAVGQSSSQKQRVVLEARLTPQSKVISDGIEWRVYQNRPNADGKLPLLAYAEGGVKAFDITPGEYLVHAAYGHAGAVKRIIVDSDSRREEFNLNAGGLRLSAIAAVNTPIPNRSLRFDIFSEFDEKAGQRRLLARDIRPDEVVAFPVGTYHVVSRFGSLNAEVRADLRVQPGKLTEANMLHRAAMITFRLVRSEGGDAIADTAWSILTESGDVIEERASTFPTMVLAEGNYTAIAKNNDTIYSQDFRVRSGINHDVEVLAVN